MMGRDQDGAAVPLLPSSPPSASPAALGHQTRSLLFLVEHMNDGLRSTGQGKPL